MTHTYKINGMTCGSCRAQVQTALSGLEGIENVDVDLNEGKATINMSSHISTKQLQNALKPYPRFQLSELDTTMVNLPAEVHSISLRSWLQTYKPVLLIFGYLIAVTLLFEFKEGSFDVMRWLTNFMGGFFIIFSFFKLLDLKGFAESYSSYDIVARTWFGWGYIYPFVELGLGLAFLSGSAPLAVNTITLIVMSISIVGVLKSVLNKKKIKCACLGTVFKLPMSTVTIIEDGLMIAMAAGMLSVMF